MMYFATYNCLFKIIKFVFRAQRGVEMVTVYLEFATERVKTTLNL